MPRARASWSRALPAAGVGGHVRDRDREEEAVGQGLDQDGPRRSRVRSRVDGDDRESAQVEAAGERRARHGGRHAPGGGGHLGRELRRQAVGVDHGLGLDARVVGRPEDERDLRLGVGGHRRPAGDRRHHHVAVGGAAVLPPRHDDRDGDALLLRPTRRRRSPATVDADDALVGPLETPSPPCRACARLASAALDRTGRRSPCIAGRTASPAVDVVGVAVVGDEEGEAGAVHLERPATGRGVGRRPALALGARRTPRASSAFRRSPASVRSSRPTRAAPKDVGGWLPGRDGVRPRRGAALERRGPRRSRPVRAETEAQAGLRRRRESSLREAAAATTDVHIRPDRQSRNG